VYTNESVIEYYQRKNLYWSTLWKDWGMKCPWSESLVEHYYKEARRVYRIELDYDQFKRWLTGVDNRRYVPYRYRRNTGEYYHREKRGYQKKAEHKKKELSEEVIRKREWREKKRVRKDKAKSYWKCGAGKYYKNFSNKLHRQWERRSIENDNYDMMSQVDHKFFLDPWLWD